MRLPKKTLALALLMLVALTAIPYFTLQNTVLQDFKQLELQSLRQTVDRAREAVSQELGRLSRLEVPSPADAFADHSQALPALLQAADLHFVALLDSSGRLLQGAALGPQKGPQVPFPSDLAQSLDPQSPFFHPPAATGAQTGLLPVKDEFALLASKPAPLRGSSDGPQGLLVWGRYLRKDRLQARIEDPSVSLALEPVKASPQRKALAAALRNKPVVVRTPNPETITGYTLLEDVSGEPALILSLTRPRTLYAQGRSAVRYNILAILTVVLIAAVFLILLLRRLVAAPLARLSTSVSTIGESGDFSSRVLVKGRDELSNLAAEAINSMLSSLEASHAALSESEKRYRALVETIPYGILEIDLSGRITFANRAAHRIHGCSDGGLTGEILFDFAAADSQSGRVPSRLDPFSPDRPEEPVPWTGKHRCKDGRIIDVQLDWSYKMDRRGRIIGCIIVLTDITRRQRAEEERMRLATAVEQAAESIIITDRDGTIQYVNPAFEAVTGFSRREAVGRNPRILKSGRHDAGFYREMWEAISRGAVWRGRLMNRRKDGSPLEETASISPIQNRAGEIVSYVAVKHDVTQEVEMEKQLRQKQKMEAVGTLAGGIAHDFNNILGAVLLNTELALEELPGASPSRPFLQRVVRSSYRARDLVKQILTFSRQGEQEQRPVEVAPIVKETVKLLQASLPSTVQIRQDIDSCGGRVIIDPTQLHQVLINLGTNSADAMRDGGGTLEIRLRDVDVDDTWRARSPELAPGPYAELTVRDTGCGMEPQIMERIFEPFFTTKNPDEGVGMGLAVVHGIVRRHGGAVLAESEPGEGSTFRVLLPRTGQEALPEEEASPGRPGSGERILLVDDEPVLVETWTEALSQIGYSVTGRADGLEALETFAEDPDGFDVVITDLTMPRKTGLELARALREVRKDIPVILCTGFGEAIEPDQLKAAGVQELAEKPVSTARMIEAIRRVLR